MIKKVKKTENEWRKILTPEQFKIMRGRGTEAPFSCLREQSGKGTYHCAACDLARFDSRQKFDSETGWPSYFEPTAPDHVEYKEDNSFGMRRTEVLCARCESHLGHVFDDGPKPGGKRYCINSVALKFKNPKK